MVDFENKMDGVFTIAEIGLNHNGSLKSAISHIKAAKKCGCDAIKFQTYITEKRIQDPNSELRPILKKLELSYKDFEEIKKFSDSIGIKFFSTAFDQEAVEFLVNIGVDLFKVASFDTSNDDLFKVLINKSNKIIFSTGMTEIKIIESLVNKISNKVSTLGILHCVSSYPTPIEEARLANIPYLVNKFPNTIIGYSDHTQGILTPSIVVGMGAKIVEKHFKLYDDYECIDASVSIGPENMKKMIHYIRDAYCMIGKEFFGVSEIEKAATIFKRSNLNL